MRFAHISDLHFGSFSLNPFQFFSKRFAGNFNYLLKRKKEFAYDRLIDLIDLFKEKGITHVIITGDLSVTARNLEFTMAKRFVDLLKKNGLSVFTIPGNHDHYTKRSYRKKSFYRFFNSQYDKECPWNLKEHKVTYTPLADGLWLLGLDTTCATSVFSSQGYFSKEAQENLENALNTIPKTDKIILLNHFPFFLNDAPKKQLIGAPLLKNLIKKHPNVFLYLHGHTHRQVVADLRPNQLPILSDSGSTPHCKYGACHLFDLDDNRLKLDVFHFEEGWREKETYSFQL